MSATDKPSNNWSALWAELGLDPPPEAREADPNAEPEPDPPAAEDVFPEPELQAEPEAEPEEVYRPLPLRGRRRRQAMGESDPSEGPGIEAEAIEEVPRGRDRRGGRSITPAEFDEEPTEVVAPLDPVEAIELDDDSDDVAEEQTPEAEGGEEGAAKKRRRRRRRRRKGGDRSSEESAVLPAANGTVTAEDEDEKEMAIDIESDEVAEVGGEEPSGEAEEEPEPISFKNWDVPTWDELIASLYRPER